MATSNYSTFISIAEEAAKAKLAAKSLTSTQKHTVDPYAFRVISEQAFQKHDVASALNNLKQAWNNNKPADYEQYSYLDLLDPYLFNDTILKTLPHNISDLVTTVKNNKKNARIEIAEQSEKYYAEEKALLKAYVKENKLTPIALEAFFKKEDISDTVRDYFKDKYFTQNTLFDQTAANRRKEYLNGYWQSKKHQEYITTLEKEENSSDWRPKKKIVKAPAQISKQPISKWAEAADAHFKKINKRIKNLLSYNKINSTLQLQRIIDKKSDDANLEYLNKKNQENTAFLERHQNKLSIYFGIIASAYTTVMFTQKILLSGKSVLGLSVIFAISFPVIATIVSVIVFNMLLDKYLSRFLRYLGKKESLTLDQKESIKFGLLVLIAIISVSLGNYIIPFVLFLYTAGYFINRMLQHKQLAYTFKKFLFTQDEEGVPRFFQGYTRFTYINKDGERATGTFTDKQRLILYTGSFLSFVYAVAMAALVVKWLYPLSAGLSVFAIVSNPIGIVVILLLAAYLIYYQVLIAQKWAQLIQLDVQLKQENHGKGLFSWLAAKMLLKKIFIDGAWAYIKSFAVELKNFFANVGIVIFGSTNKTRLEAAKEAGLAIVLGVLNLISLVWKLARVFISVAAIYGMFYMLDDACSFFAESLTGEEPTETDPASQPTVAIGQTLTWTNFIAQIPFALKNIIQEILPDRKEDVSHLSKFSQLRNLFYRVLNAIRNALVPTEGELATDINDRGAIIGTAGASFTMVRPAIDNANITEGIEQEAREAQQSTIGATKRLMIHHAKMLWSAKQNDNPVHSHAILFPKL